MLELLVAERPDRAIAVVNRGLYVDQAALLRSALPGLSKLTFLVGFDKIVQVFDPRYYADHEAALDRLFALASFAVAPRAGRGFSDLDALLLEPANSRYASRIQPLAVPADVEVVSSSAIRAALARGEPPLPELPLVSRIFVEETGCYLPDSARYARRAALLSPRTRAGPRA
jgi:hypothetical protein